MSGSGLVLELFAGPGGFSEGARSIGLHHLVGVELDAAACATRAAAGHRTVRADAAAFEVGRLAGRVAAVTGSPPCTFFSSAGTRAGTAVMDVLAELVRDMFAGRPARAGRRREMAAVLRASGWPNPRAPRSGGSVRLPRHTRRRGRKLAPAGSRTAWKTQKQEGRGNAIRRAVLCASLVAEPARYIAACRPEWVALEQVPEVLPLWKVYAEELRKMGYSAWCGKLNAADYGVPQTRERAILIASRVRTVRRPAPTHYDPRKGMQLFGTPWVSMAESLGYGATRRPAPAVTAGGTATGGAEPLAKGGRAALEAARDAGEWALRTDAQANATCRPVHAPAGTIKSGHSSAEMRWVRTNSGEPSPTVTHRADRWVMDPNASGHMSGYTRPADEPSPTLTGQVQFWKFRNNNNNNACTRSLDEPAGTLFFGARSNWASWVQERPATTVLGRNRIGRPGHKNRDKGESQFELDSVRVTPEEAAALQSFPPGYPFQGSRTKVFEQIGNAVPCLFGAHILAEASGARVAERAA